MNLTIRGVSHVLLDIEGTTCPVSFVAATLFPYASNHLARYLEQHQHEPAIATLLEQVDEHQRTSSPHPSANPPLLSLAARVAYLQSLIQADIKLTALKDIQGRIWREGYERGQLTSPLFDDVAPCLQTWHDMGMVLAVYSSGSVAAQKLLYQYSNSGDLTPLFSYWFDTHQGPKQQASSYQSICQAMAAPVSSVLFISDSPAELLAAQAAGLSVVTSDRPGNPQGPDASLPSLQTFHDLTLLP
jgi:enolase-phosphatase E1